MSPFDHVKSAAKSDVGRKRKNNEDSFGTFPSCGLWCVADGMGGGDDGEIASAAVVEGVRRFCAAHPLPTGRCWVPGDWLTGIARALSVTSKWIFDRARERKLKGCGSTFVGLSLDPSHPDKAVALHAGDSRLYLIRGKSIKQITKDHSAAELIGEKNEQKVNPLFRGMILRAVGICPSVELERTAFGVKPGDRVLVCSDGLSKMVPDRTIGEIVRKSGDLNSAADALVAAANEAGGHDNVTVVLVEIGELPQALPTVPLPVEEESSDAPSTADGDADTAGAGGDASVGKTIPFGGGTEDADQDAATCATMGAADPITPEMPLTFPSKPWFRCVSPKVLAIVAGALALMVAIVLLTGLFLRRSAAANEAAASRQAELSAATEAARQLAERNAQQRVEKERELKAADERKAADDRRKEREQFQKNVDLPVN